MAARTDRTTDPAPLQALLQARRGTAFFARNSTNSPTRTSTAIRCCRAGPAARMRTREVWIHAVDLANGATFTDIPEPVLERLLTDITGAWKIRDTGADLVVKVTDRDLTFGDTTPDSPTVVTGTLAAVVEWAAGRGTQGVTATPDSASLAEVPAAPKWI